MPELYIITGSNGAGKSTVGPDYLPVYIQKSCDLFDGDKLLMEKQRILWKSGIRVHKEAKKIALAFVEEALISCKNFAYEGHFTNEATWVSKENFRLPVIVSI